MRIWDINPGYLNDKSLLGEHVELHSIVSIIINGKKGYSNHPETKRWMRYQWAINKRHELLISEMKLRGFRHSSHIEIDDTIDLWPNEYIDSPKKQFDILCEKYKNKEMGRIPLPNSMQQLWRHHKYSVMARDIKKYKEIGSYVADVKSHQSSKLYQELVDLLRLRPSSGGIKNALQHMWGYFKKDQTINVELLDLASLLEVVQKLAYKKKKKYILESTALSEFEVWI